MRRRLVRLGLLAGLASVAVQPAHAVDCPGNPDAIGTSRTIVVDPREHPRIGTMQYPETLPLRDHEVVLTFDDGPLPPHSKQILDILAKECVKATFFTIGRMATMFPAILRRELAEGHSIGTHTQDHPLSMNRMPIEQARQQIDKGIASATAALGDPNALAPFLRIPGLLRAKPVEDYLASKGIQVWSADFPADDWRHISSDQVYRLAISRIEAKHKGILLLHDIHERTVEALPRILRELKARGYHIVHVVPATPSLPKTPTDPQDWKMHPVTETVAISHWPKVPSFAYADTEPLLPAPAVSDSDLHDGKLFLLPKAFARSRRFVRRAVPLPEEPPWPREVSAPASGAANLLPIPEQALFSIPEKSAVTFSILKPLPHHADAVDPSTPAVDGIARLISIDASAAKRTIPGSQPVTTPGLQPASAASR